VLEGGYADILWRIIERDTVPGCEEQWRVHLRTAVADFRALVELLRRGEVAVIFPEGEPSESGEIGLLQGGLASLVRRGRPRSLQPVAIAYDPLLPGRTRAYVSVAEPLAPASDDLERAVRHAFRAATPLTAGQLAASAVMEGSALPELRRAADGWIARALADGRPVARELSSWKRERMLERAWARARRLGPSSDAVRRLARELRSAHELSSEVGTAEARV
jgi:hypothetical protein